jgi:hypothetical protein
VLNSMAFGIVPLQISDRPLGENFAGFRIKPIGPVSEGDFKQSEMLKQRAAAMVDRLDASDDLRRRTHRDLALWYKQLGKSEKAEKEKHILFKLVGSHNDSILYPQSPGCGGLVWWKSEKLTRFIDCGMG